MPQTGLLVANIFKCFCSLTFPSEDALTDHAIIDHDVKYPYCHPFLYYSTLDPLSNKYNKMAVYSEYALIEPTGLVFDVFESDGRATKEPVEEVLPYTKGGHEAPFPLKPKPCTQTQNENLSKKTNTKHFPHTNSGYGKLPSAEFEISRYDPHKNERLENIKIPTVYGYAYQCPLETCIKTFFSIRKVSKHAWKDHQLKLWRCNIKDCGRFFAYDVSLTHHRYSVHKNFTEGEHCNPDHRFKPTSWLEITRVKYNSL